MRLTVNGETKNFETENLSLSALLKEEKVELPDMVSVQLNGEFASSENYSGTFLKDGDLVNFLYFMGGGSAKEEL